MRYLKLFESFEIDPSRIHEICEQYYIKNYTINPDRSIDVDDDVYLNDKNLTKLILKFNKVSGNFWCSSNKLKSLDGVPNQVGSFSCTDNYLISLEGSPLKIENDYYCDLNLLKSFKGVPKIIRGVFSCNYNYINSFEYFPSHVGEFSCIGNPIFNIWKLFEDVNKIELLNDCDIFRNENEMVPSIIIDRLNDFLVIIGNNTVEKIDVYNNL